MTRKSLPILLAVAACTPSQSPDDPVDGKADRVQCQNGKTDARAFPSPLAAASIVEMANTIDPFILSFTVDGAVVDRLVDERERAPFETLVEVACIRGVGTAALRSLHSNSFDRCGVGDAIPASFDATPRLCADWTRVCGNELSEEGGQQGECLAPAPEGTFVREFAQLSDPHPRLPIEVTFADGRYAAIYSDGRELEGRAQQAGKIVDTDLLGDDDELFSYMSLRADNLEFEEFDFFEQELSENGETLVLSPLIGPVGRDVEAPVFDRAIEAQTSRRSRMRVEHGRLH